jgi:hypothetical protein
MIIAVPGAASLGGAASASAATSIIHSDSVATLAIGSGRPMATVSLFTAALSDDAQPHNPIAKAISIAAWVDRRIATAFVRVMRK